MPTGGGGGSGGAASTPLTYFTMYAPDSAATFLTANQTYINGFVLPFALTFSKIGFWLQTADGANNSDVGIYSQAGSLLANIGAQLLSSTGDIAKATVQGAKTLQPGLYIYAITSVGNLLSTRRAQFGEAWVVNASGGVSTGGALPNSIGAQSIAPTQPALFFYLF